MSHSGPVRLISCAGVGVVALVSGGGGGGSCGGGRALLYTVL